MRHLLAAVTNIAAVGKTQHQGNFVTRDLKFTQGKSGKTASPSCGSGKNSCSVNLQHHLIGRVSHFSQTQFNLPISPKLIKT